MATSTLTPSEILDARARGVRRTLKHLSYEEAVHYSLRVDPALAKAYAEHPHAITPQGPTVEAEAAARRAEAGREVVRRAQALVARAGPGALTMEQAIHAALNDDAKLTREYLGWV